MNRHHGTFMILATLAALALPVRPTLAAGTPAGTMIVNQASVSYQSNGSSLVRDSNPASIRVDEKLDLILTWEDSASIRVEPGDQQAMLTFRLTNLGNDGEASTLNVTNTQPGDQFDPLRANIFLDSNGNGVFDAGDRPYDPGNPPWLAADANLAIFVFNDIPAPLAGGDLGLSQLTATAMTGSGAPGTVFPPPTREGNGAVVGASGGQSSAEGSYQAGHLPAKLVKSATVSDPRGGSEPMPGALITYAITVTVEGSTPARAMMVTDPVPEHTAYIPGSLRLLTANGSQILSDAVDDDRGQIIETPPGSGHVVIEFPLGDLDPGNTTVTFQVTIL